MKSNIDSDVILERMLRLHPKIIDLTLDRIERCLSALGNPENQMPPVIHLAGTNGKGSTQSMIRAGLEAAGQKVHAYTSPHLARFHERIRIAGELITEEALIALLDEVYEANCGETITYFEITTAAAMLAFARTPADWTLLEVGLGGRVDATNVMKPAVSVITPVDLDHEQFLGETLGAIAFEKAGIIKKGVPVVIGPQKDEALAVIENQAMKLEAPIIAHGQHWHVWKEQERLIYQDENGLLDLPLPNLPGPHQIQNAGQALAVLRHLGFEGDACEAAVSNAFWPARMQRLKEGRLIEAAPNAEIWLDGGHNPAAGLAIAATLGDLPRRPTYLVCGMLSTKDAAGYLRPLAPFVEHLFAVSIPDAPATLSAEETADAAKRAGMKSTVSPSIEHAIATISDKSVAPRILICGSLYLAGNVLKENG